MSSQNSRSDFAWPDSWPSKDVWERMLSQATNKTPHDDLWIEWWKTASEINGIYGTYSLEERSTSPVKEKLIALQEKLSELTQRYKESADIMEELAK